MNQLALFAAGHVQRGDSIIPRVPSGSAVDEAELARKLRDDGIKRASDHADKVSLSWTDRAHGFLLEYIAGAKVGTQFQCEDVRKFAEGRGFATPPDKRAWGGVMLRGSRASVIRKIGWAPASDPKVHCNPVSLWEVR